MPHGKIFFFTSFRAKKTLTILGVISFFGTETNYFWFVATWHLANQNSSKLGNFEHPHLFKNKLVRTSTVPQVAIGATQAGVVCTPDNLKYFLSTCTYMFFGA